MTGKERHTWSEADEAELREMVKDGASQRKIGERFGLTHIAVARKMNRLGLVSKNIPGRPWTEAEIATLRRMWLSPVEYIANELNRPIASVRLKALALGMNRRGIPREKRRDIFFKRVEVVVPTGPREEVDAFLLRGGKITRCPAVHLVPHESIAVRSRELI